MKIMRRSPVTQNAAALRRYSLSISPLSRALKLLIIAVLILPVVSLLVMKSGSAETQAGAGFANPVPYIVATGPYWTTSFTSNFGAPALAVSNRTGNSVSVLFADGTFGYNGNFLAATTYSLTAGSGPQQVIAGKLGQSSYVCLVIAAAGTNQVAILLSNSSGFQATPVYYNVGTFPESVALGDLNGDGNLDLIAANYASNNVSVLLGNNDRTFQTPAQTFSSPANPESIVVADFNADNKLDVATCNSGTNPGKINVLLGNGNGTLQAPVPYNVGTSPYNLAVSDLNGDGKPDLVTANNGGNISVLLNSGSGSFPSTGTVYTAGAGPYSVSIADFNVDGFPDIAVANGSGTTVNVLQNTGSGTFLAASPFNSGSSPRLMTAGDFNLDGKPDLAVPNFTSGTVSVLLNNTNATPPQALNDNFANAQLISGSSAIFTANNAGATSEPGEPRGPNVKSIWYRWQAPATAPVTIRSSNSAAFLAVYSGSSLNTLTEISRGGNSTFNATAGVTYYLGFDSLQIVNSEITLNPPVANNNLNKAQFLDGNMGTVSGSNVGANKESGESNHAGNAGGKSVWYAWGAQVAGQYTFTTAGSNFDTLLAVYTANTDPAAPNSLTLVAQNDNEGAGIQTSRVTFPAQTNTLYYIAVDGAGGAAGQITLRLIPPQIVLNDDFANAYPITGSSGSIFASNQSATREFGEYFHAGRTGYYSIWYKWQPSVNGNLIVSEIGRNSFNDPSYSTQIAAYTGNSVSNLAGVVSNFATSINGAKPQITITGFAGTTYYIAIDSIDRLNFTIEYTFAAAPSNDNFVNAQLVSNSGGIINTNNLGASKEPGELNHAGDPGGHSLWYKLQPSVSGSYTFTTFSSLFNTVLGVYTGPSLNTLTTIASNNDDFSSHGLFSTLKFQATAGTTYYIAVDGQLVDVPSVLPFGGPHGSTGDLILSYGPTPTNDDFANAQTISGASGSVNGTNVGATRELSEPFHSFRGRASIWYRWQAPNTGVVTFNTTGSNFNTLLGVYSAFNIASLIGSNDFAPGGANNPSSVTFPVVGGTTYFIVIDGRFQYYQDTTVGNATLNWSYNSTTATATIRGQLVYQSGERIFNQNVTLLQGSDFLNSATTDDQGYFQFSGLTKGLNYTVDPGFSFGFNPQTRTYTALSNDQWAVFVARTPSFNISGVVRGPANNPLSGISVKLDGAVTLTVTTAADGSYLFPNLPLSSNYRVSPLSSGYGFTPDKRDYYDLSANFPNDDYAGANLPPTVATANASLLILTGATLNGNVNPNSSATNAWFEWGTDLTLSTNTSTTPQAIGAGASSLPVSAGLSGLTPATTYYFRAVAMNSQGTIRGSILSFTTPIAVTVQTNPAGRSFSVDGISYTTTQSFNWIPSSNHTISTTSPQSGGTGIQYAWTGWNDGLGISHSVSPNTGITYTANFSTQYQLTMSAGTGGQVSPASGFFNSGQSVQILATPNSGFSFGSWTGTGTGSFTGANNPTNVTMNGPITETASFIAEPQIQFSATNFNVGEGDISVVVTVNRIGDISGPATVDFASSNGTASQLRDYQVANGTLLFASGQASRTFRVLIVDDVFAESDETVNLTLSNPTGGSLAAPATATVTIIDNDSSGTTSPISRQFVAYLTGAEEVPTTPNSVKGNGGVVQLSLDELSAKVSLLFSGLTGTETGAHLHGPAGIGVNGPILFPLPLGNPLQNVVINPTSQQVANLRMGQQYLNVHSSSFPNGEIRGQLLWNPAEEADFFVRQAYFDFLSRVPDPSGFNFWVSEITNCQTDVECLRRKRVDVSNAFFYEQEFQQTAAYVFRLYRAAYGNNQPFPNPNPNPGFPNEDKKLPSYAVFVADRARVVGGASLAQTQLNLANLFVSRVEFATKYPASLATATQFVDAILATLQTDMGVNLSSQRANLINLYNTQGGRGAVMYRLADDDAATNPIANQSFIDEEYNRSFVVGQYFGYLRRNPDIPGFLFWLGQVNGAPLRDVPRQHAMVCSFMTSTEYQLRFGPVASRNNNECQ